MGLCGFAGWVCLLAAAPVPPGRQAQVASLAPSSMTHSARVHLRPTPDRGGLREPAAAALYCPSKDASYPDAVDCPEGWTRVTGPQP